MCDASESSVKEPYWDGITAPLLLDRSTSNNEEESLQTQHPCLCQFSLIIKDVWLYILEIKGLKAGLEIWLKIYAVSRGVWFLLMVPLAPSWHVTRGHTGQLGAVTRAMRGIGLTCQHYHPGHGAGQKNKKNPLISENETKGSKLLHFVLCGP